MSSRPATPPLNTNIVAAVHGSGRSWRCLVGRLDTGRVTILDQREIAADRAALVQSWLDEHQVSRVMVVLPASAVICRTCPLPNGTPEQLDGALRLQAEASLLGQVPSHRTALAVLHPAADETTRCGLVLAWPESAAIERPLLRPDQSLTFVPDVAALAALLDGNRPSEPLIWADRRDGSVAIAVTHANGATFRATREDAADDPTWAANLTRVMAETAINVGHGGPYVDALIQGVRSRLSSMPKTAGILLLPESLKTALADRIYWSAAPPNAGDWWSDWGIAAGAMLAASDQLAPLTQMLDQPPIEIPTPLERASAYFSRPRFAAKVVAACIAILALSPLLFSGGRLLILKAKVSDLRAVQRSMSDAEAKLVVYEELHQRVWPMTKLLSDLASSTPMGIDIYQVNLDQDLRISGVARKTGDRSPTENILLMSEQLQKNGVFTGVRQDWKQPDFSSAYKFNMAAQIKDPYRIVKYSREQDFAEWPAFNRVNPTATQGSAETVLVKGSESTAPAIPDNPNNGEAASRPDPPDSPEGDDHSRIAGSSTPDDPDRSLGKTTNSTTDRGSGSGPKPPSQNIPDALTQEQIDAMDLATAKETLGLLARARSEGAVDDATRKRLREDFLKVQAHMRKINPPPNSSAPGPSR